MHPKRIIEQWVETFNTANAETLAQFYHEDAINHQVNQEPVVGKKAIKQKFESEFIEAKMVCIIENIFDDGEWVILEWKDPLRLRGCGFFHVVEDKIKLQRGYWDLLSFLRQHKLPIPTE